MHWCSLSNDRLKNAGYARLKVRYIKILGVVGGLRTYIEFLIAHLYRIVPKRRRINKETYPPTVLLGRCENLPDMFQEFLENIPTIALR